MMLSYLLVIVFSFHYRTGYIGKPTMKRILDSLLDPIPEKQGEHLLRFSKWGEEGAIDYNDFINNYKGMYFIIAGNISYSVFHKDSILVPFSNLEQCRGSWDKLLAEHFSDFYDKNRSRK